MGKTNTAPENLFGRTRLGVALLKDGRILQANSRLAAMLGREPQELIGMDGCTLCSLYAPGAGAAQESGRSFPHSESCGSFADDVHYRRKDGTRFWGRCGLSGLDPDAPSNDAIWMVEDVSERKQSERTSRITEERLQRALDASQLALWDYDVLTGEVYLSETWSELLGGAHAATRTTFEALAALVPAEDQAAITAAMIPAFKGERPGYQVEHRVRRLDGEYIWILSEGRVAARDAEGRALRVVGTNRNITERKRGEAQQRLAASVFDNAAEGILISDKDNNILSVNRAFTEITGYAPEEVIGKNPRMLSSGWQSGSFYDEMWAAIRDSGRWQGEVWDRRKDGRPYCERLSIAAIRDEQGEIAQYCAIFSDVTKLKATEAELLALNAELEQRVAQRTAALDAANKELETFSYSVSHDLRAPLRHISGFGALLLQANQDKLDALSVDHLRRIVAASERMGLLIADLLALSRVSRQELNKRDIDLSDVARRVADALIQAHPQRQVEVRVSPNMRAGGDPGLVRIVLENLIGNAWKFTALRRDARIEVVMEQRDGEIVYCVRDNGAGFDMSYAHKLFEPFQRLHSDSEFKGTGIGLSIVRRIVARHGGRIWAEARVGEGAGFHFTLG